MAEPGLYVGQFVTVVATDVFSDKSFERIVDDLFRAVAPSDRLILGFGDNVPTDALFHRIKLAAPIWADRGDHWLNCLHTHPRIGQIRFPSQRRFTNLGRNPHLGFFF